MDSSVFQMIAFVHKIHESIDKGQCVTTVYLDVGKAFDKVWHKGLLFKLKSVKICGKLLKWFESYLENRKQRVVIKGQASQWYTTNSGVPQGSVLGPFFNIC